MRDDECHLSIGRNMAVGEVNESMINVMTQCDLKLENVQDALEQTKVSFGLLPPIHRKYLP